MLQKILLKFVWPASNIFFRYSLLISLSDVKNGNKTFRRVLFARVGFQPKTFHFCAMYLCF